MCRTPILTIRRKSLAILSYASLFLVFANAQRIACLPLVAYGVLHTGISSQYRLGWSRVLEHPSPGLDAGAKLGLCSIWTHDSVPRTQPGRPAEQGCALLDASASLFQRRIADCCLEHWCFTEAAKLMIERPEEFKRNVKQSLRGGYFMGRNFPKLLWYVIVRHRYARFFFFFFLRFNHTS